MNQQVYFLLILFFYSNQIWADKNVFTTFASPSIQNEKRDFFIGNNKEDEEQNNCRTQFDPNHPQSFEPNKTFLTFYGDSLGDLINEFAYGYFSWDQYLTLMYPAVEWNVQNLAHSGDTTFGLFDMIKTCAASKIRRVRFKTSPNVAFEIGGNDYWQHAILLGFMPWKFMDVQERITFNTRAIIYALRHPRRDKNVLVMGNFPNLSYSPSLGHIKNFWVQFATHPDPSFKANMEHLHDNQKTAMQTDAAILGSLSFLQPGAWLSGAAALLFPVDLTDMHGPLVNSIIQMKQSYNNAINKLIAETHFQDLNQLKSQIKNQGLSPTKQDDWYWTWLYVVKNNPSMISSMGMFLNQGPLEEAVNEVNNVMGQGRVHFLPMYHLFLREKDCFEYGWCFVGKPELYADEIGHLNYLGYLIWSNHVARKVVELNWHRSLDGGPPRFDGAVSSDSDDTEIKEIIEAKPVEVHPSNIDILILICLFTGKCW
ncbi:MAG: SGNH/GDSL hydrolase family protein [Leptospira sp.]|nr:SGNH/GDSL hydrolase family protein [Leptospira sp.]NCS94653.1 SGNH/GDSL hydrolase family protein [Leptospira sp.]